MAPESTAQALPPPHEAIAGIIFSEAAAVAAVLAIFVAAICSAAGDAMPDTFIYAVINAAVHRQGASKRSFVDCTDTLLLLCFLLLGGCLLVRGAKWLGRQTVCRGCPCTAFPLREATLVREAVPQCRPLQAANATRLPSRLQLW